MLRRLRAETAALRATLAALSPEAWRAAVVSVAAVALVLLQLQVGTREFFYRHGPPHPFADVELGAWAWWFGMQGLTGFVVPVLILLVGFRWGPGRAGLGLGDWKLAGALALLYLPLVAVGTWVLSDGAEFQAQYPHYQPAAHSWRLFAVYQGLFLLYWMGWEYLWRGFMLFGTAPALGAPLAVVAQTVPFALLHADKPPAEAYLSILGGLALGALVWRCRSFWIAVPIHWAQMVLLDTWCSLRLRTGASGLGLDALRQALAGA